MPQNVSRRRSWLVPEVVQTSAMDCGPAVLKCLLAGYGIRIHYGRLREACQTDLDGTSIDTLEAVANRLGLSAEQVMLPPDHVLLPESNALPAILIVRLPDGATHFVLVWRRHGPLVQVMDPALGRRWMNCRQLIEEMYNHRQQVPAEAWREWAVSDEMVIPLRRRMFELGVNRKAAQQWIDDAVGKQHWRAIAALDAAVRTVQSLVRGGGIRPGGTASKTLHSLLDQAGENASEASILPDRFWSVLPCPAEGDEEQVWLKGAVLVRIHGRSTEPPPEVDSETSASLGQELEAALQEPESRPLSKVFGLMRGAGWFALTWLVLCIVFAAAGTIAESILLRGILDLRRDLATVQQRLLAIGGIAAFGLGLMVLEYGIGTGLYRLGRRLEIALRVEFLSKIPRLHDRYFQSRPTSDMAERGHSLHRVRMVPRSAGQFFRATVTLALTAAAIAWIEPAATWLALAAAVIAIALPILFLPMLQGLDLRVRTHVGALTRFTFDALSGLSAVRAHVARHAVSLEHEALLVQWGRASFQLLIWRVLVDGLQALTGISMAAWLLLMHASHVADATGVLLLAYWALSIPTLGEEIAQLVHQYPSYRNVTLRLLEPLGAPEQDSPVGAETAALTSGEAISGAPLSGNAVSIRLEDVCVRAGGHTILESLSVTVPPGSHLAVVGPSGAGKSSLVGLLLGWHRAAGGQVLVDGRPLDADVLTALRRHTVWVDPAVQLWNRSMLENILYGNSGAGLDVVGDVVSEADLYDVLQRLPDGMQTPLGESGGLLSGGEAQRVKLARGFARNEPRLVILDEPFRGLERSKRRVMLERARERWTNATLICITHDVSETLEFPRVLVLSEGRLVEDGLPNDLLEQSESLFGTLLDAENEVRTGLWGNPAWRRIRLNSGRVVVSDDPIGASP